MELKEYVILRRIRRQEKELQRKLREERRCSVCESRLMMGNCPHCDAPVTQ